jgi:Gram-negative bacterial TonB protein C-terminal
MRFSISIARLGGVLLVLAVMAVLQSTGQPKPPGLNFPRYKDPDSSRPLGVQVAENVSRSFITKRVEPASSAENTNQGHGIVVLHILISEEGKVVRAEVLSGPEALTGAALAAVKQWEYRPYLLNHAPVKVDTLASVEVGAP